MRPQKYGYWIGFRRPPASDVPAGWKLKRLQELATFAAGGRLGLTMSDYVDSGFDTYSAEGLNGKTNIAEFEGPAVIVSSIGARCGKCFLAKGKFTTLANVQVVFPVIEALDASFLWNVVNDERFWPRYATAQPFIRPSDIKKSWIPVPPPDEQTAIARILDAVDTVLERTRAAVERARELRQSLIHNVLTRGIWNGQQRRSEAGFIPKMWSCEPLGELLADGPTNGVYRPESDYAAHGTPIIRIDDFEDGRMKNVDALRRVVVEPLVKARYAVRPDDVLVNRVNSVSHIGKATLVPSLHEPTIFESNMMRVRCGPRLLPGFLNIVLCSDIARRHWLARAKPAVNQASINQRDTRELPVPIPDRDGEQAEIVAIVAAADKRIDALSEVMAAQQQLKKSFMHDLLTGRVRVRVRNASKVAAS